MKMISSYTVLSINLIFLLFTMYWRYIKTLRAVLSLMKMNKDLPSTKTAFGMFELNKKFEQSNAVNLGIGICDFPTDNRIEAAAIEAIVTRKNAYCATEG